MIAFSLQKSETELFNVSYVSSDLVQALPVFQDSRLKR